MSLSQKIDGLESSSREFDLDLMGSKEPLKALCEVPEPACVQLP